jgi:hypothetical protein
MPNYYFFLFKIKALFAVVRFYLLLLTVNPKIFIKIFLMAIYLEFFSVFSPGYISEVKHTSTSDNRKFLYGYNLFSNNYGNALSANSIYKQKSAFDLNYFSSLFRKSKASGADVIKLWLFQGLQGISVDETTALSEELSPELLQNLKSVLYLANFYKLKVYIGLLNGNDAFRVHAEPVLLRNFFINLFSKKTGGLENYQERILRPLFLYLNDFNAKHPETIYAIDLFTEIEGATHYGYFKDPWSDSREWIKNLAKFTKSLSPELKFTISAGWDKPTLELLSGYYSGLDLDFYDIHSYSDQGNIRFLNFICNKVMHDNKPVILGEFGQRSSVRDDQLQLESTVGFVSSAKNSCFSAAFAWHMGGPDDLYSYTDQHGSLRPAAVAMENLDKQ